MSSEWFYTQQRNRTAPLSRGTIKGAAVGWKPATNRTLPFARDDALKVVLL
jgi:hypothetical protein